MKAVKDYYPRADISPATGNPAHKKLIAVAAVIKNPFTLSPGVLGAIRLAEWFKNKLPVFI